MVRDSLDDGTRIAQLLSSELDADGGDLDALAVADADRDVEPTTDGAYAFAVVVGDAADDGPTIAEVFVQPDRARVEFLTGQAAAAEAAADADIRVRPKAVRPPRTLVFVEDGRQVKRLRQVFAAALAATGDVDRPGDTDESEGPGDADESTHPDDVDDT